MAAAEPARRTVVRWCGVCDSAHWLKILLCLFSTVLIQGGLGLRDVRVLLPDYVLDGADARLVCRYNMEGDALYAVKWYKGSHEFYRYIPKEVPPIQVFPIAGLSVDVRRSNDHDVVLTKVSLDSGGDYKCVVSAESPFQTLSDSRELLVLLIGDDRPFLQLDRFQYHPGDSVTVHCHVPAALPSPPNITWYLNNLPISGGGDLVRRRGLSQAQQQKTEPSSSASKSSSSSWTMTNDNLSTYNRSSKSSSSSRSSSQQQQQHHQHNHQQYQTSMSRSNNNHAPPSSSSSSSSTTSFSDSDRDFTSNGGMLESTISFDLPGSITPVQIKCRARIHTAYDQNVTIQIVPIPRRLSGPDTLLRSSGSSTSLQQPSLPLRLSLLDSWSWWSTVPPPHSSQSISIGIQILAIIIVALVASSITQV